MKINNLFIIVVIILFVNGCASPIFQETDFEERAVALQKVIAEIQSALALVNDEIEKNTNLKLNSAFLVVNTVIGKTKEGGADLWVVSGKVAKSNKNTDKVSIKLVPIARTKIKGQSLDKTLSERLAMSIVSAVKGVSNAGSGKYPMSVEILTIEMAITTRVTSKAGAAVKLEVLPVSISGKSTYSKSKTDLLRIKFTKKK